MALSTSARKKHAQQAMTLLPPGTTMRSYVIGRAHARITNEAIIGGVIYLILRVFLPDTAKNIEEKFRG